MQTIAPAPRASTDSRLAALCAAEIWQTFRKYEAHFDEITRRARTRFLARDWRGSFDDAKERLLVYTQILNELLPRVTTLLAERLHNHLVWSATKAVYSSLIARSPRWEIAESFFNSVTRRVFVTKGVDQSIEFVDTDFDTSDRFENVWRSYSGANLTELICQLLTDRFEPKYWSNLESAAQRAAARLEGFLPSAGEFKVDIVDTIFYRGRGAYIVGRAHGGGSTIPLAFCVRHPDERGVTLDALLHSEADLAILFSYTRAYFRANTPCAFKLVRSLRELMPGKRVADLYNAIGFNRHAKTEFYRDFVRHLQNSDDRFVVAEGARGMVMIVFTLPSYDVVFKLIRDRFDLPKENDRSDVMRRYRIVFEHDRAGRLVEAHEFEHLRIGCDRFDPALLDHLLRNAASTVRLENGDVLIAHTYVERRVRPLNLFLAKSQTDAAISAAFDYAQAIKDLAASNIFPGDLLTKNFGLTRRGRVVFYDYDELCFLTDCNFRNMPQATSYEEEIAAEPWFSIREHDIFPEEFLNFLTFPKPALKALLERHGDVFHPEFWRNVQNKLRAGELPEIFPYADERRLTT